MNYTIGTGRYRLGAPYSELKTLLEQGYRTMKAYGIAGDNERRGAHLYARTFRQFYEQCGEYPPKEELQQELLKRVLVELGQGERIERNMEQNRLEPITPAVYPEPETHITPEIPEERVEPRPSPINDRVASQSNTHDRSRPQT